MWYEDAYKPFRRRPLSSTYISLTLPLINLHSYKLVGDANGGRLRPSETEGSIHQELDVVIDITLLG